MKALTIRNVPPDVARALESEKKRRGGSLNQTVIDLLRQSLGTHESRRSNGLRRLAGTWSRRDLVAFEKRIAPFEQVDEDLWS